jgi:hypothetical protein
MPFFFSTGNTDGRIATATRPSIGAPFEIESADDFVLTGPTTLTSATFTGRCRRGARPPMWLSRSIGCSHRTRT